LLSGFGGILTTLIVFVLMSTKQGATPRAVPDASLELPAIVQPADTPDASAAEPKPRSTPPTARPSEPRSTHAVKGLPELRRKRERPTKSHP
jgi:hypothetical protein